MSTAIDRFFQGYAAAFNRSLGDRVDIEGIRAHFSPCFIAAGPQGVRCGQNDDTFDETLRQGYAFYAAIGMKQIVVRAVTATPIDDRHQMAKVAYRATYEKAGGESLEIRLLRHLPARRAR